MVFKYHITYLDLIKKHSYFDLYLLKHNKINCSVIFIWKTFSLFTNIRENLTL